MLPAILAASEEMIHNNAPELTNARGFLAGILATNRLLSAESGKWI